MSEQTQATLENRITEAIDLCVNDLGLKMPLNVVTIDMGGHILAATIHGDGRIHNGLGRRGFYSPPGR